MRERQAPVRPNAALLAGHGCRFRYPASRSLRRPVWQTAVWRLNEVLAKHQGPAIGGVLLHGKEDSASAVRAGPEAKDSIVALVPVPAEVLNLDRAADLEGSDLALPAEVLLLGEQAALDLQVRVLEGQAPQQAGTVVEPVHLLRGEMELAEVLPVPVAPVAVAVAVAFRRHQVLPDVVRAVPVEDDPHRGRPSAGLARTWRNSSRRRLLHTCLRTHRFLIMK